MCIRNLAIQVAFTYYIKPLCSLKIHLAFFIISLLTHVHVQVPIFMYEVSLGLNIKIDTHAWIIIFCNSLSKCSG